MSDENVIRKQAQKGFQAVQGAVGNVTEAAADEARQASGGAENMAEDVAAGAGSQAASAFARQLLDGVQQQAWQQFQMAGELSISWARAYNQIVTQSADIYMDAMLRSWEYNRNVLDSAGRALEDAVGLQRRLMSEMSRTLQGYVDNVEEQYGNTDARR